MLHSATLLPDEGPNVYSRLCINESGYYTSNAKAKANPHQFGLNQTMNMTRFYREVRVRVAELAESLAVILRLSSLMR